jgi:hypothetical protein
MMVVRGGVEPPTFRFSGWRWWLLKIIMGGFRARQVTLGKGLGA